MNLSMQDYFDYAQLIMHQYRYAKQMDQSDDVKLINPFN